MLNAAPKGRNAAQPSSATLGRMMRITPPKATNEAIQVAAFVRSLRMIAPSKAVIMGVVKLIAVASANGIRNIEEKKQIVAAETANPRKSCVFGMGIAKACLPSLTSNNTPNPAAPTV